MTTHDEMAQAKNNLQSYADTLTNLGKEVPKHIQTAISALDALLNAGECFLPQYTPEQLKNICETLGATELGLAEATNEARSEDTAILAKRMMGLEEVIRKAVSSEWLVPEICPPINRIVTAITAHLTKGEKK